jgi:uncharacterized protein RhaS with RHS repeats
MKSSKSFSLITVLIVLLGYTELAQAMYNPESGTWLSRDPIGERGGENLYGFVRNGGVNTTDYLGKQDNKDAAVEKITLEMKPLRLQIGNCSAVRWDVEFSIKGAPKDFKGVIVQRVYVESIVKACGDDDTPFTMGESEAKSFGGKVGDKFYSAIATYNFEGWNTSGAMRDSWYNGDARSSSKGKSCKGYNLTKASAYVIGAQGELRNKPAQPAPPESKQFPFVTKEDPLFPADFFLPPNLKKGYKPDAMSNTIDRTMRVDYDCCKGEAKSTVTIDGKPANEYNNL